MTVICALGTTAPLASVTVPVIWPRSPWLSSGMELKAANRATRTNQPCFVIIRILFFGYPPRPRALGAEFLARRLRRLSALAPLRKADPSSTLRVFRPFADCAPRRARRLAGGQSAAASRLPL